jgi:hypothetical protein
MYDLASMLNQTYYEELSMENILRNEDRYTKIIDFICVYKNISRIELFKLLRYKESKYLLLLLLKEYKCADINRMCKEFNSRKPTTIKNSFKKAEEKFFVNKEFREMYYEVEEMIKKII